MATLELSKAAVKRKVLSQAAKMSSYQINEKINELLYLWQKKKVKNEDVTELEMDLVAWADLLLKRNH